MIGKLVDTYIIYQIVRKLSTPFNQWPAFKLGVIDQAGNILVPKQNRTKPQADSLGLLDTLVLNLKKLLGPTIGSSRLATYAAALFLIKESDLSEEGIEDRFKSFFEQIDLNEMKKVMDEDAPINAVGDGSGGVKLYQKPMMPKPIRRKPSSFFGGHPVFDTHSDTVWKSRYGKKKHDRYNRYLSNEESDQGIKDYAKSNHKKAIILRDSRTGAMTFLRHPRRGK